MTVSVEPILAFSDNYIWAIIDNETRATVVVDPGDADPVIAYLNAHQLKLVGILITHHHWDHTNGIDALKARYKVPVYAPTKDNVSGVTHPVKDNETIRIPHFPISFRVIAIPGHTLGHCAYYSPDLLFCGDTLFAAGCGRIFEGTAEQMYTSLQKLAMLPAETKLYCGHEYTLNNLKFAKNAEPGNAHIEKRITAVQALREKQQPSLPATIGEEIQTNPFLRCHSDDLIEQVSNYIGNPLNAGTPVKVFAALRYWKDNF